MQKNGLQTSCSPLKSPCINKRFLNVALRFQTQHKFLQYAQSMLSQTLVMKSFYIEKKGNMQKNQLQMRCSPLNSPCINNRFLKVAW